MNVFRAEMKSEIAKIDEKRREWDKKIRIKNEELLEARCNIQSLQTKCSRLENALQSVENRLYKSSSTMFLLLYYVA